MNDSRDKAKKGQDNVENKVKVKASTEPDAYGRQETGKDKPKHKEKQLLIGITWIRQNRGWHDDNLVDDKKRNK